MVKERAIQHEIDVHARLLAEEQAQADEIAAEEKVRLLAYTIRILELTARKPSLDLTLHETPMRRPRQKPRLRPILPKERIELHTCPILTWASPGMDQDARSKLTFKPQ